MVETMPAAPVCRKMGKFATFDAVDYLVDDETISKYITAALEDSDPDVFLTAVRDVACGRGMAQLARDAGLGRESIHKALRPGAKPRYDTMSNTYTRWVSSTPLHPFIHELLVLQTRWLSLRSRGDYPNMPLLAPHLEP